MALKRMNWSKEEENKLAQTCVSVFEEGESQISSGFRGKFRNDFYDLMGCASRNFDEICFKWHDSNVKCCKFNGIYNILNNLHENNIDVVNVSMDQT